MRITGNLIVRVLVAALVAMGSGMIAGQAAETSSGSGVMISAKGEILTNAHVVEACQAITVKLPSGKLEIVALVARDERNDLAVVQLTGTNNQPASVAIFREGAPLRAGDAIVVLGYPLSGLLAKDANLSVGNVSALAGLADDSRYVQISAPVQPGNSGGPLLDGSGHLVGIVTAKLNALRVARFTGDIPENVNFALKAEVARTFLDSKRIAYQTARTDQKLSPADVGDIARAFTVYIECKQSGTHSASTTPLPKRVEPTRQQMDWCSSPGSVDRIINGCTAVLQSVRSAWAFKSRALAYSRNGDIGSAIRDLTDAIELDPGDAATLLLRGQLYSDKGDYDRAFADWDRSIGVHEAHRAYWLLWNYIERGRIAKNSVRWEEMRRDLAAGITVAHLNKEAWPFAVIEFYLGNRSAANVMTAAITSDERCEAQFYLGEWFLSHGENAAGTAALRIAANTCPKGFYESHGAIAELTRLKAKK
jgi:tetratricopeptide (TPR) repeat protein